MPTAAAVSQISAGQLRDLLRGPDPPCVLDVREDWEYAISRLPGSLHIPLYQIPLRLKELDASRAIIAVCKVGARSQRAAEYLLAQGYSRVANLTGGMDAWAREVDPGPEHFLTRQSEA
jgi:adenylyltransferase/sulfurtransferase